MADKPAKGLADVGGDGSGSRVPRPVAAPVSGAGHLCRTGDFYAADVCHFRGIPADLVTTVRPLVTQR